MLFPLPLPSLFLFPFDTTAWRRTRGCRRSVPFSPLPFFIFFLRDRACRSGLSFPFLHESHSPTFVVIVRSLFPHARVGSAVIFRPHPFVSTAVFPSLLLVCDLIFQLSSSHPFCSAEWTGEDGSFFDESLSLFFPVLFSSPDGVHFSCEFCVFFLITLADFFWFQPSKAFFS